MATTREVEGKTLAPGLYRHKKSGGLYTVLGLIRHHETGRPMVVYYSHSHDSVSTRPLWGFAYFDGCNDCDGFLGGPGGPFERFELVTDPDRLATEFWVSATLRRNFDLFETALNGVGLSKSLEAPPNDARIARVLELLEGIELRARSRGVLTDRALLSAEEVVDLIREVRKELIGESADVGGPRNTSGGAMDPESSGVSDALALDILFRVSSDLTSIHLGARRSPPGA